MQFRRSVGILTGICALSLTLGRSSEGCEKGSLQSRTAAAVTMSGHGGMHHQSPVDGGGQKPCTSSTLVCCQAMTSCGVSASVGRTVSTDDLLPGGATLPATPFQTPLKRVTAPEPPPPKA